MPTATVGMAPGVGMKREAWHAKLIQPREDTQEGRLGIEAESVFTPGEHPLGLEPTGDLRLALEQFPASLGEASLHGFVCLADGMAALPRVFAGLRRLDPVQFIGDNVGRDVFGTVQEPLGVVGDLAQILLGLR